MAGLLQAVGSQVDECWAQMTNSPQRGLYSGSVLTVDTHRAHEV